MAITAPRRSFERVFGTRVEDSAEGGWVAEGGARELPLGQLPPDLAARVDDVTFDEPGETAAVSRPGAGAGRRARSGARAASPSSTGCPTPATCAALAHEAHAAYPDSSRQVLADDDGADGRGGMPARALHTAGAGAVQDALYASSGLQAFLSAQCGHPIVPSGNRGSYSYYVEPGDHLGLHLDVDTCDVTLITVLHDDTDPADPGGGLAVYPARLGVAAAATSARRRRTGSP